jgi:hypothetical protein
VEFEGGDLDYPIWAGCFWQTGELPATPALAQTKVWKTEGVTVKLNDLPGAGGLTLEVGPPLVAMPLKVVLGAKGLELTHGTSSVKLGPVSVTINNGALEVM